MKTVSPPSAIVLKKFPGARDIVQELQLAMNQSGLTVHDQTILCRGFGQRDLDDFCTGMNLGRSHRTTALRLILVRHSLPTTSRGPFGLLTSIRDAAVACAAGIVSGLSRCASFLVRRKEIL